MYMLGFDCSNNRTKMLLYVYRKRSFERVNVSIGRNILFLEYGAVSQRVFGLHD